MPISTWMVGVSLKNKAPELSYWRLWLRNIIQMRSGNFGNIFEFFFAKNFKLTAHDLFGSFAVQALMSKVCFNQPANVGSKILDWESTPISLDMISQFSFPPFLNQML